MDWALPFSELLWRSAWAAIPLVIVAALLCRGLPMRPATRHTIWLAALSAFVLPIVLPRAPSIEFGVLIERTRGLADAVTRWIDRCQAATPVTVTVAETASD